MRMTLSMNSGTIIPIGLQKIVSTMKKSLQAVKNFRLELRFLVNAKIKDWRK
ncbi:MAG: hypothetical protein ACJA2S_002011 [Cyclobacteriaceae bacterium]|jgi:hypothetical protein